MIKIPSLNGLRAISIIIVVLAHLKDTHGVPSILYSFISLTCFGNLGVEIFFVISGYLITTILLSEVETNNKINFKRFYIRRFLRIFPVLIAYLLFILSLNSYYHIPIIHFIKSLLYFNNFAVFGGTWLLGHTWSLSVEEQFYMVWPFVINKLSKYIALITGSVFVLAIILRLIGLFRQDLSDVILNPFIGSLDGILIGSYMGFLVYNKNVPVGYNFYKNLKAPILSSSILLYVIYSLQQFGNIGYVMFVSIKGFASIIIAFLILYCIQEKNTLVYKFLNIKSISYIGVLSYSIYIWQQFFLLKLDTTKQIFFFQQYPYNIICVFIVAIVSYEFFEKPILKLKDKFFSTNKIIS